VPGPDLVQRFEKHRTIGSAPREQLEWLAERSLVHCFQPGDTIMQVGEPIRALFVILTGHTVIRVNRGGGSRKLMEWFGGDVSGVLPFSRLGAPPGRVTAEEPSELAMMSSEHFPELIARCPELTAIFVHVMLDRARRFTKADLHDEKMLSLGRLSAGLAHELNNPASAVARSAKELRGGLAELEASALALGAVGLSAEQLAAIAKVRSQCEMTGSRLELSPLERADRQDAVAGWLDRRGIRPEVAEAVADTPLSVENLEPLAKALDNDALGFALHSLGAGHRVRALSAELQAAADRIHALVAAVKGFTHMDQTDVPKPVAIGQGLADTIMMLRSKSKSRSVTVSLEVPDDLPPVEGFGGELNQVWQNLIDNAIDAAPDSGHVDVSAERRDNSVVVRVVDDGDGIPPERAERLFEPFFTTKPQGLGTGLGLDIARRLVLQHDGHIEFDSRKGRTEFRVTLPLTASAPRP
jgi:signal transduction histidine kinase